ncbi:MAG: peptide ABC transporter substrate-binding protein [Puniceicoccales bacterium]|jgi:oligopeptide transport system substrate-binding protein|nr:peptide ABC transporter substrate-binding protein [Puniceicoccales bacterium]
MKKNLFCWSLALALVSGCGPKKKPMLNVLNVGCGADLATLDPQVVDGKIEENVLLALFEALVSQDPKTLEIRPGVASHWECSADGLEYSFTLREGLRWSNGDPLVAEDFVYSLKRVLSPNLGCPFTSFFFNIRNAEAYYKGQVSDFREVGIRATDARHLKMTLEHPVPYFLELVAHSIWFPVHRKTIEKFGPIDRRDTPWTRPEHMVCNGPFVLASWESGRYASVKKNPYYWDKNSVALDEIRFHPVADTATEERMYAAGELDITFRTHVSKIPHYRETGELYLTPQLGCLWVGFHCEQPPVNDVRVRRALGLAINREEIGRIRGFGKGLESFGVVPPGMGRYKQQPQLFREDMAEAKRLLAEAGYPDGKGFPKVELLYYTSDENRQIFEAVQAMWKRNLGIQVDLVSQEWKVYISLMNQGNFTIVRHRWFGDYNDPTTMLSIFMTGDPCNFIRWSCAEFDATVLRAQEAKSEAERIAYLQEAERIFVREMPGAPVYWEASSHLVSHRVRGWYPNVMDEHPWKYVSKLPAGAR